MRIRQSAKSATSHLKNRGRPILLFHTFNFPDRFQELEIWHIVDLPRFQIPFFFAPPVISEKIRIFSKKKNPIALST